MYIFLKMLFPLFVLLPLSASQSSNYNKAQPPSFSVDTKKFSGLWYEIARTYNSFEKDCVGATVEYKFINSLEYEVTNRCFKHKIGADLTVYNGVAKFLKNNKVFEIEKTYYYFFSKRYRVIYLDSYKTVVIADKEMQNVWIMNREPFLNKSSLKSIVSMLGRYMDTSRFIYTIQDKSGRYK